VSRLVLIALVLADTLALAVERIRTDIQLSNTIAPPLPMERNQVKLDGYNLLVGGAGFNVGATYPWGETEGQLTSWYYSLNDGYLAALFNHLVAWVEKGTARPTSRIGPVLMDPLANPFPNLPTNDPTRDSLNRAPSSFGLDAGMAALEHRRDRSRPIAVRFAQGDVAGPKLVFTR